MGFDTKILPDKFLRKLPPAERKKLGKAGLTMEEVQVKADTRAEKVLQNEMEGILRQRNLFFSRSRMDRATTLRKGMPDFFIVLPGGRALLVEAKVEGGNLREDQQKVFSEFWKQTGDVVHIVLNLPSFCELLDTYTQ